MKRIGVRELRQQASVWLRRVEHGESFEVTVHGRPVALMVPYRTGDPLARLRAQGRLIAAKHDLLAVEPAPPPTAGEPALSEILADMRADER